MNSYAKLNQLFEGFANKPKPPENKSWTSSFHIPTAEEIEEFPALQAEDCEIATVPASIGARPFELHLIFNGDKLKIFVRSAQAAQVRFYSGTMASNTATKILHILNVHPSYSTFASLTEVLNSLGLEYNGWATLK